MPQLEPESERHYLPELELRKSYLSELEPILRISDEAGAKFEFSSEPEPNQSGFDSEAGLESLLITPQTLSVINWL